MERRSLQTMMEIAVMAGIGVLFSTLITISGLWPQGGSVSLVMVPIVVLAFRRGWMAGVVCGLIVGLLNLMIKPYVVHPVQLVLDYPAAFAALGLAGVIRLREETPARSQIGRMITGVVLAGLSRFLFHFVSGVIWFGSYAPEGMSPAVYSFLYNISYILPDIIVSAAVMALLMVTAPQLVMRPR